MNAHTLPALTDCGLPGIREIPYGIHMCHLYRDRAELAAVLAPFFAAGLRSGERCLWVTARPLEADDAKAELRATGTDVDAALERGALTVVEYDQWYERLGNLSVEALCGVWLAEEARALADGYNGLRLTGNVTFLKPGDWQAFMDYEDAVDRAFRGRRIVALCTYPRSDCGAVETFEIVRRHNCALDRPDQGWQILTP